MVNKKKENLSEFFVISSALLTTSLVVFVVSMTRRIIDIVRVYHYHNSVSPDRFEEPVDKKRTKKLQEIVGDSEPIVHYITGADFLNAYSDGSRHVYYSIPLARLCTNDELMAVLIHEYGHYKEKHSMHRYKSYAVGELMMQAALTGISIALGTSIMYFVYNLLTLFGYTAGPFNKAYTMIYSHPHEFMADSYAKKYGYEKELITFLKKMEELEKKRLCKLLTPEKCQERLEDLHKGSTHPSSQERVKKLLAKIAPKLFASKSLENLKKFGKIADRLGEDFFKKTLPKLERSNSKDSS